jgi:hypothetical protein
MLESAVPIAVGHHRLLRVDEDHSRILPKRSFGKYGLGSAIARQR